MPNRSADPQPQPTEVRLALLALTTVSAGVALDALIRLLRLARQAWLHPVLFYDSFELIRPGDRWGPELAGWLFRQHNEHRIVLQRLSSLIGEAFLGMPPGAGGIPANVLMLLAISGCLAWLCGLLIRPRLTACCCWLVCTLLAWNPWQQENILWEFQTPWFLINLIVLLSMAIQIQARRRAIPLRSARMFAALAPALAIFSTGQGLAAAVAMTIGAAFSDRRSGVLAGGSTGLSLLALLALGYHKPAYHPALGFRLDYFHALLTHALPDGRGLLLLALLLLSAWVIPVHLRRSQAWILCQPIVFSGLFALMTTLSRSGFGVAQALAPRYVTHSLLIGINLILVIISQSRRQPRLQVMVLTLSLLLIVAPWESTSPMGSWTDAYSRIQPAYTDRVVLMDCALRSRGRECLRPGLVPDASTGSHEVPPYLSGSHRLRGWHQQVVDRARAGTGQAPGAAPRR